VDHSKMKNTFICHRIVYRTAYIFFKIFNGLLLHTDSLLRSVPFMGRCYIHAKLLLLLLLLLWYYYYQ